MAGFLPTRPPVYRPTYSSSRYPPILSSTSIYLLYLLSIYRSIYQSIIYLSLSLSNVTEIFKKALNEILPFAATWMDLEGIMLSEMSQTEKDKYCMIALVCEISKIQQTSEYNQKEADLQL